MSRCPHACAAVAPADVEQAIASEHYFTALAGVAAGNDSTFHAPAPGHDSAPDSAWSALGAVTFCVLRLRSGGIVYGAYTAPCLHASGEELCKVLARQDALLKVWPLLHYALQSTTQYKDKSP